MQRSVQQQPRSVDLRPYQEESVQTCIVQNTIISLPTGSGKTLVAVRVIDHFCAQYPGKAVLFIVPTRSLAIQQAEYVRKCAATSLSVCKLYGQSLDHWIKEDWTDCLKTNDVLVGTAEVFRSSLVDKRYIVPKQFSLIIFDECHNACKNSPMAGIMNDAFIHVGATECPRIVGLTASFINGALKNPEKKRKDLEALLRSTLFSPDVLQPSQQNFIKIKFIEEQNQGTIQDCAENIVGSLVLPLLTTTKICHDDINKVSRDAAHVCIEAGKLAFLFYIREGLLPQLEAKAEELKCRPECGPQRIAQQIKTNLPRLQAGLRHCAEKIDKDCTLQSAPAISAKAIVLIDLLSKLLSETHGSKGIIFVKQIALAFSLAFVCSRERFFAGTIVGSGSMTDVVRNSTLEKFRSGELKILVCTTAVEEGIDVPDCDFVVRYSKFDTTKSHIQGSGRARAKYAMIYYFENEPEHEAAGAALMAKVAKDPAFQLDADARAERTALATAKAARFHGVYPFEPDGTAQVNMFNALNILLQYSSKVLRQSVQTDDLCVYSDDRNFSYAGSERTVLVKMMFPSPSGMIAVTRQDADAIWSGVHHDEVDVDRQQDMTAQEMELRSFAYAVVVSMRQQGFLTQHNEPSPEALEKSRFFCPFFSKDPEIRIRAKFSHLSFNQHEGPTPIQAAANMPVLMHRNASVQVGKTGLDSLKPLKNSHRRGDYTASTPISRASATADDFKSALNLLAMANWKKSDAVEYVTEGIGPFHTTVSLPGISEKFLGTGRNKRGAEQEAAKKALAFLRKESPGS